MTLTDIAFSKYAIFVDNVWEYIFNQREKNANVFKANDWIYSEYILCGSVRVLHDSPRVLSLHRCYYFLSSSHLVIWGADKNGLLDDSSLFLQPASVPPSLYFQVRIDQTGNVFILLLSVMSEAAVRQSVSASSYRFKFLFRASSFSTIDLWINPKQTVINSEPPDKVSSSCFIPSVIWCEWMLITSCVSLWPRRWSLFGSGATPKPNQNPSDRFCFLLCHWQWDV